LSCFLNQVVKKRSRNGVLFEIIFSFFHLVNSLKTSLFHNLCNNFVIIIITATMNPGSISDEKWPALSVDEWQNTLEYLTLCMQVAGKIKLALTPKWNHWWNVALHVYSEGITTGVIYHGSQCFQLDFDFKRHMLLIKTGDGKEEIIALQSQSVAGFYTELKTKLCELDIHFKIWTRPVEMEYKVHFEKDTRVRNYNAEYAARFHNILKNTDHVMRQFRSGFTGKTSDINFYWGAMDLALTFFSGRPAPPHPGSPNIGRDVMLEAYSHEVSSMGFWPGTGLGEPAFYAYSYPEPAGYKTWDIQPEGAYYHPEMGEFILHYEKVRQSADPENMVLRFFKSAHDAARSLGHWDEALYRREYLEKI
jgi:hypothetical protein